MRMIVHCCGTCKWWDKNDECGGLCPCTFQPVVPFWVCVSNGDHEDWTESSDGKHCKCYEPLLEIEQNAG